ncbi:hypothetical protein C0J50_20306 [Silurus asotus]|uniref:Ig-like domain-containing protein n=1 Tax=Silurus asotus TaxID=30991 RepID=A0AAD5FK79_SILAS|nr:hypothetical protein C0J50_20306 [Silurus asotus]
MVTLQEVEGTTITLHTGITGIQTDARIDWFYGPEKTEENILISQMFKGETVTEISERFKERLQLNRTSGALTIRNISRNHSGVYLLQVITGRISSRTFRVSVYAPVSTPVINLRGNRSLLSTESCSLLCSVKNGEDVNLSWYRENERISITNNTDLSVPLNLPLQIQHHEKNTYICVSANPVSNKTTSVSISQLCVHNSGLLSAAGDEMVTLQEVEGTTINLHTGILSDAQIQWFYGPEKAEEKILNSQMFKGETVTEITERFKERLQLDRNSGALTIRNISRNHSGVYLLHVITEDLSSRTFRVSVYGE